MAAQYYVDAFHTVGNEGRQGTVYRGARYVMD
eukprot:COSAG02_NODE_147_length_33939_cov_6.689539_11_plen_32_part_00